MKELLIDNEYLKLEVEWQEGIPFLHLVMRKWSHNILKHVCYPLWLDVLQSLKDRGCRAVMAVYPETDSKIGKFHAIMGMHEAARDGGYIISRRWL